MTTEMGFRAERLLLIDAAVTDNDAGTGARNERVSRATIESELGAHSSFGNSYEISVTHRIAGDVFDGSISHGFEESALKVSPTADWWALGKYLQRRGDASRTHQ